MNRTDLDLMAAAISLSGVLNIFFKSGVSQGANLSDTLRSLRGACFSVIKERMLVPFCTVTLMSCAYKMSS